MLICECIGTNEIAKCGFLSSGKVGLLYDRGRGGVGWEGGGGRREGRQSHGKTQQRKTDKKREMTVKDLFSKLSICFPLFSRVQVRT